jgi:hypothetical protein
LSSLNHDVEFILELGEVMKPIGVDKNSIGVEKKP